MPTLKTTPGKPYVITTGGAQKVIFAQSAEMTLADGEILTAIDARPAFLRLLKIKTALPAGFTTISYLENAIANQGIYTNVFSFDGKIVEIKAKPKKIDDYLFGQYPYVDGKRYLPTMQWAQSGDALFHVRSSNRLVQYWQPDKAFFTGTPRVYKFNDVDKTLTVDNIEGSITSHALTTKFNDLPFALMGLTYVNTDLTYYIMSDVGVRCYYFKLRSAAGVLEANYIPCLDASGKPCMFDTVSKQAFYNAGEGDFIAGIDATAQINTLLHNLPDLTGQASKSLQIRLAAELQNDNIRAAIDAAAVAKNWEITEAV